VVVTEGVPGVTGVGVTVGLIGGRVDGGVLGAAASIVIVAGTLSEFDKRARSIALSSKE
jgi:hypothetical protein